MNREGSSSWCWLLNYSQSGSASRRAGSIQKHRLVGEREFQKYTCMLLQLPGHQEVRQP